MKICNCVCFLLLCLPAIQLTGTDNDFWMTDVQEAIKKAADEKKDLLLLYTGSDWCPPCKKLESEVFSQEEFVSEAKNNFVFVMFDFPKEKLLPPETMKQNEQWAAKYGVEGYPTVVLVDNKQRPYAITGYREGGVENYLGILGEFSQKRIRRDEAFAKAEGLEGGDKAKALDEGLSQMDTAIAELYYDEVVAEIVAIDKEDTLGLRTKWNESKDSEMRKIIMTDIVMVSRLEKPELAIDFIDKILDEIQFTGSQRLQIFQIKLSLLKQLNDVDGMDEQLDQMIDMQELTAESRQRLLVKKVLFMVGTQRKEQGLQLLDDSIGIAGRFSSLLWLAKGQLLNAEDKFEEAIKSFEKGIAKSNGDPDVLVELYGNKADSYMSLKNELRAIQTLDEFAENEEMPVDLRSESLLHKAMIMRDSGRKRRATLVENRAIEINESPAERAEMQKLVERLRMKYGG